MINHIPASKFSPFYQIQYERDVPAIDFEICVKGFLNLFHFTIVGRWTPRFSYKKSEPKYTLGTMEVTIPDYFVPEFVSTENNLKRNLIYGMSREKFIEMDCGTIINTAEIKSAKPFKTFTKKVSPNRSDLMDVYEDYVVIIDDIYKIDNISA